MKNFSAKKVMVLIVFFAIGFLNLARGQVNFTLQGVDQCGDPDGALMVNILGSSVNPPFTIRYIGHQLLNPSNVPTPAVIDPAMIVVTPLTTISGNYGINALNSLPAGQYTVTVTNSASQSTVLTKKIYQAYYDFPLGIATNFINFDCNASPLTGSVDVTISGGIPFGGSQPYEVWVRYTQSGTLIPVGTPGYGAYMVGDVVTIPNLSEGIFYSVYVEDNSGGLFATQCGAEQNFIISDDLIKIKLHVSNTISPDCNTNNGGTTVTIENGTHPFVVNWYQSSNLLAPVYTETITNPFDRTTANYTLPSGAYTVSISDNNNCNESVSFTLTNPGAPSITDYYVTNVLCTGGNTGAITVNMGAGSFGYLWSNGVSAINTISNLLAGTYGLTVTNTSNNCTASQNFVITEPLQPLGATFSRLNVTCNGGNDGLIQVTGTGGVPPYTVNFGMVGGTVQTVTLANSLTPFQFTGLYAGNYGVTITDSNGCNKTFTGPAQPLLTITQPTLLEVTLIGKVDVLCYGNSTGSVNISSAGGTGSKTYLWNNGTTTEDLTNIAAGNYTVTVTDVNSCTAILTVAILQPLAALSILPTQVNVLCNGESTGSISLAVSGGTPAYAYNWSNGSTTSLVTGLAAGSYTVTVNDSHACSLVQTYVITQPLLALSTTFSRLNVSCFGGNDGLIQVAGLGGTPPYTVNFAPVGGTVETVSLPNPGIAHPFASLYAGNYAVTITDYNGCFKTYVGPAQPLLTINQPTNLLVSLNSQTNVLCFGNSTGAIDVNVSGGTPSYSYSWTRNGISYPGSQDLTNIPFGVYALTVTDGNNCAKTLGATITQPTAALQINSYNVTNVLCNGDLTGSIFINVVGGTTPYYYLWSNGGTNSSITGVAAGNYSVVVTDANGCTISGAYEITQPLLALSTTFSRLNVSCFGGNDGLIQVAGLGGTPPYTVNFAPVGGTVETVTLPTPGIAHPFASLYAGNYAVTITDYNGCFKTYVGPAQPLLTINQPTNLLVSLNSQTNVLCFGNSTGAIDVNVLGGTPSYSYSWTRNGISYPGSQDLTNIPFGVYALTVTDGNSCAKTLGVTITQPANPLTIAGSSITNVLCNGDLTGAILFSVDGGTPSYSYLWSNGATTSSLTGVAAGNYSVTATDINQCKISGAYEITQPLLALSTTFSRLNVSCFGGNDGLIQVAGLGGTHPYTVNFSPVGGTVQTVVLSTPGISYPFPSLFAGNYAVTITDANGCFKTYVGPAQPLLTINQPTDVVVSLTSQTNVLCFGNSTGAADISVSGGIAPYEYNWTRNGISFVTTQDLTNVPFGNYAVTVTDGNGCPEYLALTITQPMDPLSIISSNVTHILCNGDLTGIISVTAYGGTPSYTYLWSNGFNTPTITGIGAGVYSITITDQNNCKVSETYTVNQPVQAISSTFSRLNVTCFGGNDGLIQVSASGGVPPYIVNFGPVGGPYQLINLLSSPYSYSFNGLYAGNYAVTITDANGCSKTYQGPDQPLLVITEPPLLVIGLVKTDLLCINGNEGSITLEVTGGVGPYAYTVYRNGSIYSSLSNVSYSAPSDVYSMLPGGVYMVVVTDSRGCIKEATVTILPPANPLDAQVVVGKNVSCYNGADGWFQVNGTGGQPPYRYSISSAFDPFVFQTMTDGVSGTLANDTWSAALGAGVIFRFNNLPAGYYLASIADANNCVVMYEVLVSQPQALVISNAITQNINCFNASTGSIDITVAGGTPTDTLFFPTTYVYNYLWNTGATTQDLNNLVAGTYTVTVTDHNGCTVIGTYVLTQPAAPLAVTSVSTDISCFMTTTVYGTIDVSVTGGVAPYSYLWSNGATTQDITSSIAGVFCVTVTDYNGCKAIRYDTIANFAQTIDIIPVGLSAGCYGQNNGSITIAVTGGTGVVSIIWSNGGTNATINNLVGGNYIVTVTDANGCMAIESFYLTQPPALGMIVTQTIANCETNNVTITPTGGTEPYLSIVWSGYQLVGCCDTIPVAGGTFLAQCADCNLDMVAINGLYRGVYFVTITDYNGCVYNGSFTVQGPACPVNVSYDEVENVEVGHYGSINIFVCCGTPPYTFNWVKNGVFYDDTEDLEDLMAGTYYLTITDSRGCTYSDSWEILSNAPINWVVVPSNEEHIIVIPPTAVAGLTNGDFIGVFYNNGTENVCGGYGEWNGVLMSIAAYGDDVFTAAKDGFVPFDNFVWKVYRPSTMAEYDATVTYNMAYPNQGQFQLNGISALSTIDITVYSHHLLSMVAGWNLISTYVIPVPSTNMVSIFSPLVASSKLVIVKNGSGQVYMPAVINSIGNIDLRDAYLVKLNAAATLDVTGNVVVPTTLSISFPASPIWRHLGYPRTAAAPVTTVLAPILTKVEMVKNNAGNVFWQFGSITINTLGNLIPGQGYKIKTNSNPAVVYIFPANSMIPENNDKSEFVSPEYFNIQKNTGSNMIIGFPKNAWTVQPAIGDEIGVFSAEGMLIGAGVYTGNDLAITLWGDDKLDANKDGLMENEFFNVSVFNKQSGNIHEVAVNWVSGNGYYTEDGISVAGNLKVLGSNASFSFDAIYPNPASTEANIRFTLPTDEFVTIEIYNSTGSLIETLVSESMQAGEFNIILNVNSYSSGAFFVRFKSNSYSANQAFSVRK